MIKSVTGKIAILCLLMLLTCNCLLAGKRTISVDTGQIIIIKSFNMPQLNRQRTLRIYLPKDYNSSKRSYPVIYMQDGQNLFKGNADIKSTWAVDSLLNTYAANQQCIIVGIDHAGKNRITEYSPYDSNYGKGDGKAYTRFLVETLKPYIDNHYRTLKDAAHTVIAGSSMGSLLAMYAVCKYPETFGVAGIFSPAFWIAPQIYKDAETADKRLKFYLTCGDNESDFMVNQVTKMDTILRKGGFSFDHVPPVKINVDAVHNEAQWRAAFPAFFAWLLKQF